MAEAIAIAALVASANFVAEKATSAAITCVCQEASAINEAEQKVREVKRALEKFRSALRSADREAVNNEAVRGWVAEVREASFMVLDALDGHDYGLLRHSERGVWLPGLFKKYWRTLWLLKTFRNTSKELDNIMPSVTKITSDYDDVVRRAIEPMLLNDSGPRATGDPSSNGGQLNRATTFNYGSGCDEDFISLNNGVEPEDLKDLVLNNPQESSSTSNSAWTVIAVWGMPGVGKTTLVRKVFNSVEKEFEHAAWVSVGQSYEKNKLIEKMFLEMEKRAKTKRTITGEDGQLLDKVRDELNQKRCLIVFDDVWDNTFWQNINQGWFHRKHNRGSRILVTTRDKRVANSLAGESLVKELVSITNPDKAWRLFCRTAFWNEPGEKCPDNLKGWAEQIVHKCRCLPLAIVAAAGIMRGIAKDPTVWERSCRTLMSDLSKDSTNSILEHSYYDLGPQLKSCFLYCAAYPEDYAFAKWNMIMLWVAEGFVEKTDRGLTLEEEAEECFEELIQRSLFQVVQRGESGMVTHCTMHDLVRNMALRLSSAQGFCRVLDGDTTDADLTAAHRISFHPNVSGLPTKMKWEFLRSFSVTKTSPNLAPVISSLSFKLLKVLDLAKCGISSFPDVILSLYILRYINLSDNEIDVEEIPEKIGRLQLLQTLRLRNTKVKRLPRSVAKLQKLRHLMFNGPDGQGFEAPAGIWDLRDLQILYRVKASNDLVQQIGSLKELRELYISGVDEPQGQDLLNSLNSLTKLRRLYISTVEGCFFHLHTLENRPVHLQTLLVIARLPSVPSSFQLLHELKELFLEDSLLQEDPCEILGSLPSLVVLQITNAYQGSILTFSTNGFPKLKVLYISRLHQLTSIEIPRYALPELQKLQISRCSRLENPVFLAENLEKLGEFNLECLDSQVPNDFSNLQKCSSSLVLKVITNTQVNIVTKTPDGKLRSIGGMRDLSKMKKATRVPS